MNVKIPLKILLYYHDLTTSNGDISGILMISVLTSCNKAHTTQKDTGFPVFFCVADSDQLESKAGADASPVGRAARRGRGNFRAVAKKLSVTDSN
jgi:hypothetical protein